MARDVNFRMILLLILIQSTLLQLLILIKKNEQDMIDAHIQHESMMTDLLARSDMLLERKPPKVWKSTIFTCNSPYMLAGGYDQVTQVSDAINSVQIDFNERRRFRTATSLYFSGAEQTEFVDNCYQQRHGEDHRECSIDQNSREEHKSDLAQPEPGANFIPNNIHHDEEIEVMRNINQQAMADIANLENILDTVVGNNCPNAAPIENSGSAGIEGEFTDSGGSHSLPCSQEPSLRLEQHCRYTPFKRDIKLKPNRTRYKGRLYDSDYLSLSQSNHESSAPEKQNSPQGSAISTPPSQNAPDFEAKTPDRSHSIKRMLDTNFLLPEKTKKKVRHSRRSRKLPSPGSSEDVMDVSNIPFDPLETLTITKTLSDQKLARVTSTPHQNRNVDFMKNCDFFDDSQKRAATPPITPIQHVGKEFMNKVTPSSTNRIAKSSTVGSVISQGMDHQTETSSSLNSSISGPRVRIRSAKLMRSTSNPPSEFSNSHVESSKNDFQIQDLENGSNNNTEECAQQNSNRDDAHDNSTINFTGGDGIPTALAKVNQAVETKPVSFLPQSSSKSNVHRSVNMANSQLEDSPLLTKIKTRKQKNKNTYRRRSKKESSPKRVQRCLRPSTRKHAKTSPMVKNVSTFDDDEVDDLPALHVSNSESLVGHSLDKNNEYASDNSDSVAYQLSNLSPVQHKLVSAWLADDHCEEVADSGLMLPDCCTEDLKSVNGELGQINESKYGMHGLTREHNLGEEMVSAQPDQSLKMTATLGDPIYDCKVTGSREMNSLSEALKLSNTSQKLDPNMKMSPKNNCLQAPRRSKRLAAVKSIALRSHGLGAFPNGLNTKAVRLKSKIHTTENQSVIQVMKKKQDISFSQPIDVSPKQIQPGLELNSGIVFPKNNTKDSKISRGSKGRSVLNADTHTMLDSLLNGTNLTINTDGCKLIGECNTQYGAMDDAHTQVHEDLVGTNNESLQIHRSNGSLSPESFLISQKRLPPSRDLSLCESYQEEILQRALVEQLPPVNFAPDLIGNNIGKPLNLSQERNNNMAIYSPDHDDQVTKLSDESLNVSEQLSEMLTTSPLPLDDAVAVDRSNSDKSSPQESNLADSEKLISPMPTNDVLFGNSSHDISDYHKDTVIEYDDTEPISSPALIQACMISDSSENVPVEDNQIRLNGTYIVRQPKVKFANQIATPCLAAMTPKTRGVSLLALFDSSFEASATPCITPKSILKRLPNRTRKLESSDPNSRSEIETDRTSKFTQANMSKQSSNPISSDKRRSVATNPVIQENSANPDDAHVNLPHETISYEAVEHIDTDRSENNGEKLSGAVEGIGDQGPNYQLYFQVLKERMDSTTKLRRRNRSSKEQTLNGLDAHDTDFMMDFDEKLRSYLLDSSVPKRDFMATSDNEKVGGCSRGRFFSSSPTRRRSWQLTNIIGRRKICKSSYNPGKKMFVSTSSTTGVVMNSAWKIKGNDSQSNRRRSAPLRLQHSKFSSAVKSSDPYSMSDISIEVDKEELRSTCFTRNNRPERKVLQNKCMTGLLVSPTISHQTIIGRDDRKLHSPLQHNAGASVNSVPPSKSKLLCSNQFPKSSRMRIDKATEKQLPSTQQGDQVANHFRNLPALNVGRSAVVSPALEDNGFSPAAEVLTKHTEPVAQSHLTLTESIKCRAAVDEISAHVENNLPYSSDEKEQVEEPKCLQNQTASVRKCGAESARKAQETTPSKDGDWSTGEPRSYRKLYIKPNTYRLGSDDELSQSSLSFSQSRSCRGVQRRKPKNKGLATPRTIKAMMKLF